MILTNEQIETLALEYDLSVEFTDDGVTVTCNVCGNERKFTGNTQLSETLDWSDCQCADA